MTNYTFQSLFDFTRTTSGTFVGSNGLIQTTPASVNLLLRSQEFDNASWSKSDATVTANATTAPDGTSTADKLAETATTAQHYLFQSAGSAATHTATIYAKAAERSWIIVTLNSSNTFFNLSNGTVGSVPGGFTAAITDAGNGWYRCSVTATLPASGPIVFSTSTANNVTSYAGTAGSGIFLWGAQLQTGSTATDYTRNNGGVYPARFDYDPATLQPKGILIEEQRVNLVTGSADFTATYWPVATNAVVTADNTTSPDGTNNADRLADNTTAGVQHRLYRDYTFTAASHTLSVFAKRNDHRWLRLFFFDGTTSFFGNFDLLNGVVGNKQASTTTTITAFGNGWYRCTMTATTAAAAGNIQLVMLPADDAAVPVLYTGTGTSLWLFGAQLEAGAFATSYIPTVASQVTRTADQCSIVAPMFAPWYNQSEGTLLCNFILEGQTAGGTVSDVWVVNNSGSTANATRLREGTIIAGADVTMLTGNVVQVDSNSFATPVNTRLKSAFAWSTTSSNLTANGVSLGDGGAITPPSVNQLVLTGGNKWLQQVSFYPTRLTNAQLQALTA